MKIGENSAQLNCLISSIHCSCTSLRKMQSFNHQVPRIKHKGQIYCKSKRCTSIVESIEKGTVLSVSVTVTAASLLTGVDTWSEHTAGGRLALWPCSPQAWPLCTLADVTCWSRLSCSVTACYPPTPPPACYPPPPPPHSPACTHTQTETSKLRLRCLLSCCSSSSSLHPRNFSSLGRLINGAQLLRPQQWLAPSTTYPLRLVAWMMGVLLSWRR